MTTMIQHTVIRESVATAWTNACATVPSIGDLDRLGSGTSAVQLRPAFAGSPRGGAAAGFGIKARATQLAPGTTVCRPPT